MHIQKGWAETYQNDKVFLKNEIMHKCSFLLTHSGIDKFFHNCQNIVFIGRKQK